MCVVGADERRTAMIHLTQSSTLKLHLTDPNSTFLLDQQVHCRFIKTKTGFYITRAAEFKASIDASPRRLVKCMNEDSPTDSCFNKTKTTMHSRHLIVASERQTWSHACGSVFL